MSAPIRLGLVGLGKIARDQHLPAIARTSGIELVAVASRSAALEGVASYPDLAAMLAGDPALDAIVMCQPPQPRFRAAHAALLAGKHVFLEKPPGATLSEVEALCRLADERGLTLYASWHSREAAAVKLAREWLAKSTIMSAHICWKEDVRVWHPGQDWIWQPGGFGVFDPGINALSILTAIMPEPVRMIAAELEVPGNCAAPIGANLSMETASGLPVSAEFDFRQTGPQSWDILVETDGGQLVLGHGGNTLSLAGQSIEVEAEAEYPALYGRFVDLVRSSQRDVDVAPLRLVADSFLVGRSKLVEPFHS